MTTDSLIKIVGQEGREEYDEVKSFEELPCGGCDYCKKSHESWGDFVVEDDVVPLYARQIMGGAQPTESYISQVVTN